MADGTVEVRDECTLWTDQDFGEACLCVQLRDHERLSLLAGETAALSPGPAAVGVAVLPMGATLTDEREPEAFEQTSDLAQLERGPSTHRRAT